MSARYSAGFSVSGVNTANTQVVNLTQTGTTQRVDVVQVIVGVASAPTNAPSFYLSRATARGTQTTTVAGNAFDAADQTPTATLDTAWSVAPTFSTSAALGRAGLATTAGGYWVWDFRDYPITIDKTAGLGLAIVNANAAGATVGTFTGSIVWEE
jgi:hypothetical protein